MLQNTCRKHQTFALLQLEYKSPAPVDNSEKARYNSRMDKQKLAGELIMRCFNLRTVAHIAHLKTTSYAEHMALKELYEGIIPLVDSFAETYQGDHGLITMYSAPAPKVADALVVMTELNGWIRDNYVAFGPNDQALQNILDEILGLFSAVRYKLRFLG